MKIHQNKFLGLVFSTDMQTQIYSIQQRKIEKHPIESERKLFEKELHDLLVSNGNKNYLMTAPSLEISKSIKISQDKFDGTIFAGLDVGKKITLLISEHLFYRYHVTERGILCMWVTTEPVMFNGVEQLYMKYTTFRINTENGSVSLPDTDNPLSVDLFKNFIQHLIYLEFSDLEISILQPNGKMGTRKEGKFFNESKSNITIVDSAWNKIIIRVGEFGVRGHFRLQAMGEGRMKRKLIYIKEFTKKGYIRNAKSRNNG